MVVAKLGDLMGGFDGVIRGCYVLESILSGFMQLLGIRCRFRTFDLIGSDLRLTG